MTKNLNQLAFPRSSAPAAAKSSPRSWEPPVCRLRGLSLQADAHIAKCTGRRLVSNASHGRHCRASNFVHWPKLKGCQVCNPGLPAPEISSVGVVLLAVPSVPEASPAPHSRPSPPGLGPAVPSWGIGLPSPAELCIGVSTEQAPSPDVLIVSASRCLHDWRATRCSQVSTGLPRVLNTRSER